MPGELGEWRNRADSPELLPIDCPKDNVSWERTVMLGLAKALDIWGRGGYLREVRKPHWKMCPGLPTARHVLGNDLDYVRLNITTERLVEERVPLAAP